VGLGGTLLVVFASITPALADAPDVSKVESFAQNVIQVLVTLAGLLAAGFFVMGGINYITSSGNPEHLDRAKKTILYSSIGLAVAIAAFVITNIVTQLATTAFGH
jgi:TRAP-type C4-dicarboxylate transport system permease small subunit